MSKLKELRINIEGILPSFDKDIYEYYLTVPENINQIDIEAIPENPDSDIEIRGNANLKSGENLITINVIEGNFNSTYNLNVIKSNNYQEVNNNLEILSVEGNLLEPSFDNNITEYKLEVSYETEKLNILAIPENENAKVEIKRCI